MRLCLAYCNNILDTEIAIFHNFFSLNSSDPLALLEWVDSGHVGALFFREIKFVRINEAFEVIAEQFKNEIIDQDKWELLKDKLQELKDGGHIH